MNWIKSFWKGLIEKSDGPRIIVQRRAPRKLQEATDVRYNNFTPRALQSLALAREEAVRLHHNFIGAEHLLLGLLALGQGVAVNVLQQRGITRETVRTELEKMTGASPGPTVADNIPYTPRAKKALSVAAKQAAALNHTHIGVEHILLGLLVEEDGQAVQVLRNLGLNVEQTRDQILTELDPSRESTSTSAVADKPKTSPITAGSMPPRPDRQPHYVLQQPTGDPVDASKRYDIYCTDAGRGTVVYRNARFKSMKHLFPRSPSDALSGFVELEQSDGQILFISRSSILRFCAPGTTSGFENVPGPKA